MNRMYHIKKYIEDNCRLYNEKGSPVVSIEKIIELFLEYLDKNNIVYGEGEFHFLAKDNYSIVDEKAFK